MSHKSLGVSLAVPLSEEQEAIVEQMNQVLAKIGGEIKVVTSEGHNGTVYSTMIIGYDEDIADKVLKRNAGRRVKSWSAAMDVTVGEARKMLETKTAEEVAKELGMSRRTLYRRLEKADHEYVND